MGRKKPPQWAEYEKLAHQVMTDLLPYAEVKWNDHIVGVRSAAYRQIDVTARWRANEEDLLLVVSVKDWKTRASIKAVDSFIAELEDVGASRAILICSGGFSKQAVVYARRCGIALMSLQAARSTKWSSQLKIPFLWERLMADVSYNGRFFTEREGAIVYRQDPGAPITSVDKVNEVEYYTQFTEAWDSGSLDLTRDTVHTFLGPTDGVCLLVVDTKGEHWWAPVKGFTIRYSVRSETWLEYYSPNEARAFIDHLNGQVLIPTYMKLNDLPTELGPDAVKITDADALALKATRATFSAELRGKLRAIKAETHFEFREVES